MSETIDLTPEQIAAWQRQQKALEQQRLQDCLSAIKDILRTYTCDMVAVPQIADGRIVAEIQIVLANPKG